MVKVDKWRLWAVGLCLTAFSGATLADSLDAERQRYLQIKQAWDSKQMDVVAQLMPTLQDYPLYPYLEYPPVDAGSQHGQCGSGPAIFCGCILRCHPQNRSLPVL
ncbi:Soluble lytic murein transglycosylase precursor [Serratia fonticola]|uniref:Soluble lytic murein transglycosylase n=1 Tax=Serratia fonticola TaxID=47917 RepID=A0A4U9UR49_SERFO|nr:Soluble lytic murein transglycosylase precursor [Serratia fonticola]